VQLNLQLHLQQLLLLCMQVLHIVVLRGTKPRIPRRFVERAHSRWRGSTLAGYLFKGDDITYKQNFRMTRATFQHTVGKLRASTIDTMSIDIGEVRANGRRRPLRVGPSSTMYCRSFTDPPTIDFKVASCLYVLAHGGSIKVAADVASVGRSTLRAWLVQFCLATHQKLRPIYMPGQPWTEEERTAVASNFASRRNFPNVLLACDGTHVPFRPKEKSTSIEFRNYKGWTSIIAVAFVDSYYRFFDIDSGLAGRAGDNTVLRTNWVMRAISADPRKWLGEHGVILGDNGASDGGHFFVNPYHAPTTPQHAWFNFCHSSTRFFVEETFGRWKNRWRFLIHHCDTNHKLTSQMVYTSAVLHNLCQVHGEDMSFDGSAEDWKAYHNKLALFQCSACRSTGKTHCIHQAAHRNGHAQQAAARRAPSEIRESLCMSLWADLLSGRSSGLQHLTQDDEHILHAEGVEGPLRAAQVLMQARVNPS